MMYKLRTWAKFGWLYATSMFLPTAIVTPRVEAALEEFRAEEARRAAARG